MKRQLRRAIVNNRSFKKLTPLNMKSLPALSPQSVSLFIFIAVIFSACKQESYSGRVVNLKSGVDGAKVYVDGKEVATTNGKGDFAFSIPPSKKNSAILLTIHKLGYGLYSKRFYEPFQREIFKLTKGIEISFDPTKDVVIRDTILQTNVYADPFYKLDTAKLFRMVPRVFSDGNLTNFGYPKEYEQFFEFVRKPRQAPKGATLVIRANTLVDGNNNAPTGNLTAYLSTVDFNNTDGMPGDYTVRNSDADSYMESVGAATIEITDGQKKYNLKDNETAQLSIPVYPFRSQVEDNLPKAVDVLYYNEGDGLWDLTTVKGQKANYNASENSYEVALTHFSVVNLDIVKTGPSACLKFRQMINSSGTYLGSYNVSVFVPQSANNPMFVYRSMIPVSENPATSLNTPRTKGCTSYAFGSGQFTRIHPVIRLPIDTYVFLVFSSGSNLIDVAYQKTNPATGPLLANALATVDLPCQQDAIDGCGASDDPNTDVNALGNTTCALPECTFVPFQNQPPAFEVVAYKEAGATVAVKWSCSDKSITNFKVVSWTPSAGSTDNCDKNNGGTCSCSGTGSTPGECGASLPTCHADASACGTGTCNVLSNPSLSVAASTT